VLAALEREGRNLVQAQEGTAAREREIHEWRQELQIKELQVEASSRELQKREAMLREMQRSSTT